MTPLFRWATRILGLVIIAGTAPPLGAQQKPASRLGHVTFPNSGARSAQPAFIRGLLLLHSFEYDDAARAFRQAQQLDPGFALAYWGEAMTCNHPLWFQQDRDAARAVLARLAPTPEERKAMARTPREQGLLEATELLFGEGSKASRDTLYSARMARLAADFPGDAEVRAFYALSLLGLSQRGRHVPTYMRAAALMEELFRDQPNHPGAAHYLIHSYDDPVHAPLGLRAARAYSGIAPAAAHAQHMTSHIFLALGMWDETVASNEVAGRMTGRTSGHYLFWLLYAYLQRGEYPKARAVFEEMRQDMERTPTVGKRLYLAQARAAYLADAGEWEGPVATTAVDTVGFGRGMVLVDFMDGWRAIERGDRAAAQDASARLAARVEAGRADSAWSQGTTRGTAEAMRDQLRAMVLEARYQQDSALALLRLATERYEALPFEFGPPETVKPPREQLGELLLRMARPAEARAEFEQALARTPRRAVALLGHARAAIQSGDEDAAKDSLEELEKFWRGEEVKVAVF